MLRLLKELFSPLITGLKFIFRPFKRGIELAEFCRKERDKRKKFISSFNRMKKRRGRINNEI